MSKDKLKQDELIQYYLDTTYIVYLGDQVCNVHIDKTIPIPLQQLLNTTQEKSACIITAWNPRSQAFSESDNKKYNQSLLSSLKNKDHSIYNALGEGKKSSWLAEESFFVLGMNKEEAEVLAVDYTQYAYIWLESKKPPSLIFTELWLL